MRGKKHIDEYIKCVYLENEQVRLNYARMEVPEYLIEKVLDTPGKEKFTLNQKCR